MNVSLAISLLEKFGITEITHSGDFLRIQCPFRDITHSEHGRGRGGMCYSLDVTMRNPKCFCFVCEDHCLLSEMLIFLALLRKSPELYEIAVDFALTTEVTSSSKVEAAFAELKTRVERQKRDEHNLDLLREWFGGLSEDKTVYNYMLSRGFPRENIVALCETFDLKHDPTENRLVIPMFSSYRGRELMAAQGRAYSDEVRPKYRHYIGSKSRSILTHAESQSPFDDDIVAIILVEGPFDVLRSVSYQLDLLKEGIDAFGILFAGINGSKTTEHQDDLICKAYKPVYSMLDNDKAGKKGNDRLVRSLDGRVPKVGILELPEEVNDPDGLKLDQFKEIIGRVL